MANLLLDWFMDPYQNKTTRGGCLMPFTHEEIASMSATTRETVSRVLGKMKRDRIISIRGVELTLLQPQALEKLAI